jgi:ribonucleoside-diphosphate reductase alpha chain
MAQSVMDYVFRRLALDYLSFEKRSALGIYSAAERQRHLETGSYEPVEENGSTAAELIAQANAEAEDSEAEGAEVEELAQQASRDRSESAPLGSAHTSAELLEQITGTAIDSPLCMTCGTKMRPAGSCYVCEGCGSTSGCS